jgi:hypothetical protein
LGERSMRRDLAAGVIVRTTGPIQTRKQEVLSGDDGTQTNYYLVLADRQVQVDRDAFVQLQQRNVTFGTVDFAPRSQLLFEVRDAAAQVVYQRSGYEASVGHLSPA